jgi:glycosyltransferase involved in cell wall biosynthesis
VDLTRFSKWYCFREKNALSENFIILYIGQLIPLKGILFLIAAFRQLLEQDLDCRLVVVTRSGKTEVGHFIESCKNSGILHRVSIFLQLDSFTDLDLISAFKCCDVVVLPSLQECSPGVILEAMAAEKPIVTTKAVVEMVRDGYNGFLVDKASSTQLADKLGIILNDKNIRLAMGRNGLKLVKEKYDWNIVGSSIIQLYKQIV